MSGPADIFGRGIGFPPRIGPDGRITWSAGETNVRESIRIILQTAPGERLRLPGFGAGLDRFLFEPNNPATWRLIQERIERSLADWEPRVRVDRVDVAADPDDPEAAVATITYRLVATQASERVTLAVPVRGR